MKDIIEGYSDLTAEEQDVIFDGYEKKPHYRDFQMAHNFFHDNVINTWIFIQSQINLRC